MKSKRLKIQQIDLTLCKDYDIEQALDYNFQTKKLMNKGRGFAVLLVTIKGIHFAIPFRSYMPNKYQLKYKLRASSKKGFVEGLDIGKTLIVENPKYLINKPFRLRQKDDAIKIQDNEIVIINKLIKAITDYNKAVKNADSNKLNDPMRFKFSTFKNYTKRLSRITISDMIV
ncbi:hypothetical protein AB6M97_02105 [Streptococcus hillyeri]|uniref:hypothetical protein n=1 Tax=Streptococcus hillyeri TaxID=2282420 RepID=UPI0034E1D875